MSHAQQVARALLEVDALSAFVTTYSYRDNGVSHSLLRLLPSKISERIVQQLKRRAITEIPERYVHDYPIWEILRSVAQKSGASPTVVDALFDRSVHSFDAMIARRYVPEADGIHGFEYTSLASFQRAEKEGVSKILHIPALDSAQIREIERRERSEWKELNTEYDSYFDGKFAQRWERRRHEIALADVIVVNSSLTAKSHIAAGADPDKTFVATLGAPPTIEEIKVLSGRALGPLSVLYAGSFSLLKGGHYLLEAWRSLNAGCAATLNVYGRIELPERVTASADGVVFHGSVPQPELYAAYEAADVLVFPTLCDGFGMVVAESLAHGLPVITTDQAGAADLLTSENGFIVPAADSKALDDALRWCLDNRDRLQVMRFKALEAAGRRQWSDFRRDLINVLDDGLSRKGYCPIMKGRYQAQIDPSASLPRRRCGSAGTGDSPN
jgi:glycosyltransferase involved in cell wall biosynthesis